MDYTEKLPEGFKLKRDEQGLTLIYESLSLRGDFTRLIPRLRPERLQQELLIKAARIKKNGTPALYALDATAGLGEDSFLLAAAGFKVEAYERDALIAALARDTLRRAQECPELTRTAERIRLVEGDSIIALRKLAQSRNSSDRQAVDVVLLDPMFPLRNKSAEVKKKFQLLHYLEKPCENEEELLEAALAAHPRKLVIKRPLKGSYLAGRKPAYSLKGKTIRYDCFSFA